MREMLQGVVSVVAMGVLMAGVSTAADVRSSVSSSVAHSVRVVGVPVNGVVGSVVPVCGNVASYLVDSYSVNNV
jgi:hypothetical protein